MIIIGGGASGTLLASQLLQGAEKGLRVTLIEKRDNVGRGVAYDTGNANHLLNVRASNMSAFQNDPGHFLRWLSSSGMSEQLPCPDGFCFVPRAIYGHYLQDLIAEMVAGRDGHAPLRLVKGECVAIKRQPGQVTVVMEDGLREVGDVVVLATGNEFCGSGISDVSAPGSDRRLSRSDHASVLLIGTGLTMIDHVFSLIKEGHRGPITAVSRRGLLPQPHRPVTPIVIERSEIPFGQSISATTLWLRRVVRRGHDWRAVVDALRPFMQDMWQALPLAEKKRFLRHARPWWDVHRHRMAPEAEQQIRALIAEGRVTIIAAKIESIEEARGRKTVRYRRRKSASTETITVDTVVECRGLNNSLAETDNQVLRDLARQGLATSDTLQMGIAVTDDGAVIDTNGAVCDEIFAVGPLTRGHFWEIVAIPDIRVRCERLASHIRARPAQ